MVEWSDKSKYNAFNSYKGLAYIAHYRAITDWLQGKGNLLPPIECSLDTAHTCNFSCQHCNSGWFLRHPIIPQERRLMPREHLERLIDFLADWGVKGICLGGGGEPLMNKANWGIGPYIISRGMQVAMETNGSLIDEAMAEQIMLFRWVGFSIDAGDSTTFAKVHRVDMFERVIKNLKFLVEEKHKTGSKVDIAYKFLVRPDNVDSIYPACKLAKKIGVNDFHVRPADLERTDVPKFELDYDIPKVLKIFDACHGKETKGFRVFTVIHKFGEGFRVKHNFSKCRAAPLLIQCSADGNVYICPDRKIEGRYRLGAHYPDPEEILNFWGSDRHRALLESIDVDRECSRCTTGEYQRQIEEVVLCDNMCLAFP